MGVNLLASITINRDELFQRIAHDSGINRDVEILLFLLMDFSDAVSAVKRWRSKPHCDVRQANYEAVRDALDAW